MISVTWKHFSRSRKISPAVYGSGVCEACSWLTNLEEGISSSGSKEVNERVEGVPVLVELCTALNT